MSVAAKPCSECRSPLAAGQRYCLACGARHGARSPQLESLLSRIAAPHESERLPSESRSSASSAPGGGSALRMPSPRISAALVLVFAAFGVLLGSVSGSHVDDTLAASTRGPLRFVVPAAGATPAPAHAPSEEAPVASKPPQMQAAPAPAAASAAPAAASTRAGGEGGGHGSGEGSSGEGGDSSVAKKLPAIKHVFVVMLADEPYASVFGPASPAHYLAGTLERRGALLVRYDAVAHEQLANGLALLSGQGPTTQTAENCPTYSDVTPATPTAHGQVLGSGCVYPPAVRTVADQLSAAHHSWRAYVQGIDEGAAQACAHPAPGQVDPSAIVPAAPGSAPSPSPAASGPYATFRNPFVYFHSLTDSPACAANDIGLNALQRDLATPARTPSLAYVVPDRCHDGSPSPCAPGAAAGMAPADALLRRVIPEIVASRAYKQGGLLVITVDEAPSSGEFADSSSCCGQPSFPNFAVPAAGAPTGHGGGTVGALLLSPFIKGPATSQEPYNHFSLLRTIEDVFGLAHLGYAALPSVKPFEGSLFSAHP